MRWVQSRNSGGPKYSSSAEELIVPGRELFSFDDLAQIVGVSAASLRTYKYGYDREVFPEPALNPETGRPYRPQQFTRDAVRKYAQFQFDRLEGQGRIPHELLTRFLQQ